MLHHASQCSVCHFNPRSLHGERRRALRDVPRAAVFQSTLPARGATDDFALRRESQMISIHAPCTGSDPHMFRVLPVHGVFQSTLPARGATDARAAQHEGVSISIHAPCTGSDNILFCFLRLFLISIHAPCTGSDADVTETHPQH